MDDIREISDLPISFPWQIVLSRPRREIAVRTLLSSKGYEVFLPTYYTAGKRGGATERALLPGYLFCRLSRFADTKVVTTPGVLGILKFGGRPAVVEYEEIMRLQQIVKSSFACQPWRYMPIGARIVIETGPLAGIKGFLCSTGKARHLIVSIHLLRRSVSVELDTQTEISSAVG